MHGIRNIEINEGYSSRLLAAEGMVLGTQFQTGLLESYLVCHHQEGDHWTVTENA